ncbi:unnamed protein product (macronuclear) [Paramecium tetraurelia]|uniref:EF-hand domain-containing protein n=1 Tax=Paramecium tetraurelia TaxID=5888 RepID=A0CF94_PARTE|nr:uncharacterized protein GSPATT00037900001 [Paramecium tetraurelia]CAK69461.1 unnamed protein product [Paramecium tetraurelia]|eukprot:XP_001436858.1 hypothetical protein (macronuclear) [Paramecium tetraurelia strain d4-2]
MSMTNAESQPIAIVSLQMEDGTEEIKVYEGEDVELEVELFCQRYKLGNDCLEYLVNQIKQQLKREPSPRFAEFNKQQFLNKGPSQTRSSKQSDFGLIISASSDENQVSAQKSYEEWQKKINRKIEANSNSKMQWNLPTSARSNNQNNPRSINTNDKLYGETNTQQQNKIEQQKQNQIYKGQQIVSETTPKTNISPNFKSAIQQKKKVEDNSLFNIGYQTKSKGEEQHIKKQQQVFQLQKEQSSLRSFQPRRSDISSRNHSQQNRSTSNKKERSNTPVNEKPYIQEKERKQYKFEQLKQEFQKMYSNPQINNVYQKEENKKQTQQQQVKKLFTDQIERKKKIEQKQREQSIQNNSKFQNQISKEQLYQQPYNKQDQDDIKQIELKQNNRSTSNLSQRQDSRTKINNSKTCQFDLNIKKIFRQLDGDKDGYISKDKVNLSGIEVQLLELVSEALYKIEEEDLVADQIQFKSICESVGLYTILNNQLI